MAFLNKFTSKGTNPPPAGIDMKNTSWGVVQPGSYTPNLVTQNNQQKPDTNLAHRKGRPGGGWDSDEDDSQPTLNTRNAGTFGGQLSNPTSNSERSTPTIQVPQPSFGFINRPKENKPEEIELIPVDEAFLQSHEYEHKLIFDTIQPGGARLKQADTVLASFSKAAETLSVPVIASILIYKLRSDTPFISKARALYDVEILVKKIGKHFEFFKHNLPTLKGLNFSLTESNQNNLTQLNNLLQVVIKHIQDPQSGVKPVQKFEAYTPTLHTAPKDLLDMDETQQPHSATDNKPKSDKPNAFGLFSGSTQQTQPTSGNAQNKSNAFGFIGAKPVINQSNQPAQPIQPTQQPKSNNAFGFIKGGSTPQAQPTSTTNKYDAFLELDLSGNTETTPTNGTSGSNLMDHYGNKPIQQQPSKNANSLSNFDFGASPQNSYQPQQQQPQNGGFVYGYGHPQQPYPQQQQQPQYQQPQYQQQQQYQQPYQQPQYQQQQAYPQQHYGVANSYVQNFGNNTGLGGHLDALENNYQGMPSVLGLTAAMTPEADKRKKEQEQEEKYFNFVKL